MHIILEWHIYIICFVPCLLGVALALNKSTNCRSCKFVVLQCHFFQQARPGNKKVRYTNLNFGAGLVYIRGSDVSNALDTFESSRQ